MSQHRTRLAVIAMAALLLGVGIARNPLPAQDGLKFIRIAREFGSMPWLDVVRRADQHPLYPALIAVSHPITAAVVGDDPTSWRLSAQGVSAVASLLLILPLHRYARALFDTTTADLTAFLFVLLPIPAELGIETLSDSLAMLWFTLGLALGAVTIRSGRIGPAIGAGMVSGLGYLTRPELALLPVVIAAVLIVRGTSSRWRSRRDRTSSVEPRGRSAALPSIALLVPFAVIVLGYASINGALSDKLSMRRTIGWGVRSDPTPGPSTPRWMPPGLDDPRWDFSPKEETDESDRPGPIASVGWTARCIGEAAGWVLLPLAIWGAVRVRCSEGSDGVRWLAGAYVAVFSAVLVRHASMSGYLSSRHAITLILAVLPWSAAGARAMVSALAERRALPETRRRRLIVAVLASAMVVATIVRLKPMHPSRWGHQAAGRWLIEHASMGQAVLDTRGWAAFVSNMRSYDYWHVRQALTDASLAYVIVENDELRAGSPRAETLRAVLDYAAVPVATFPERRGGRGVGVWVYRFRPPESWEAILR